MIDGACRSAATLMILWVQNIATFIEKRETGNLKQRENPSDVLKGLTLKEFYAGWQRQAELYEQAATTIIPFGRHKGSPLREIGRREARWLVSRLLPKTELERTIAFLDQLLDERPGMYDDALFSPHPYKRTDRRKRSLQASRLVQRVLDPISAEPTLLGLLQADELVLLRQELQEQLATGAVRDEPLSVSDLRESLAETVVAAKSMDTLEEAFETFLYGKPMRFPAILQVDATAGTPVEAKADFQVSLNWFRPNPDRLGDAEKYLSEELETAARERLERASGRLKTPKPQPIPFVGTIKPTMTKPNFRDCALLFDEETYEYVFVARLRGQGDPLSEEEIAERRAQAQNAKRQGKLRYANFPLHPFNMPERAALEIYPLEWGEASHRQRFLRERAPVLKALIERQRHLQTEIVQAALRSGKDEQEALEESLAVEPVFTAARIATRPGKDGKFDFFVQLTVKPPARERLEAQFALIGLHEHEGGYSYAVVGVDGQPMRGPDGAELVGDVAVPTHVDPALGYKKSVNFAHEMANELVRQGGGVLIGLEDTGYRKDKSDLSRERNRAVFQRPSKRIATFAAYKAQLSGLPAPLLVGNVSPSRDCSSCSARLPKCLSE